MRPLLLSAFALLVISITPVAAFPPAIHLHPTPAATLHNATDILDELAAIPLNGIPRTLLAEAQGVAIIPRVVKAGFVFAGQGGHGVVLAREKNGAWGEPVFINIGGASVGFQAGIESTDVVLIFRTRRSLDRLLAGKGKITLGVDAAVAAGPIGRQAEAGTDARLSTEILSYSRSRGLFAGVALDGAVIHADAGSNILFREDRHPDTRTHAEELRATLSALSGGTPLPRRQMVVPAGAVLPSVMPGRP
jgi:lipid-binding SYLF domain-containing protein